VQLPRFIQDHGQVAASSFCKEIAVARNLMSSPATGFTRIHGGIGNGRPSAVSSCNRLNSDEIGSEISWPPFPKLP